MMNLLNKLPNEILSSEIEELQKFLIPIKDEIEEHDIWFRFERGSGVGVSVYVKVGGIEKDITDYSTW